MNQKRSPNSKPSSRQIAKNKLSPEKQQVKSTELPESDREARRGCEASPKDSASPLEYLEDNCPVELLSPPQGHNLWQKSWRFWWQDSSWSYFNRGLFWGGLVSLTSVLSAVGGMALTHIDFVEQQISQRLPGNNPKKLAVMEHSPLITPLQILLVEVEPDANSLVGFSATAGGKTKTILLLKVEPELNLARAINIPLNSQIQIPGFGQGTVKDAYRLGGMNLLSQAINRLPGDFTVDRYLRTTPDIFEQLLDSGKITLENCDSRLENCGDQIDQVIRQQNVFKTIRQHFNIPNYLANFETAIAQVEPQLDTNFSTAEIISVANFIKELEPEEITVDLLPGYTPGQPIKISQNSNPSKLKNIQGQGKMTTVPTDQSTPWSTLDPHVLSARNKAFQRNPVVVQNTTEHPELGRRVVAYLRQRNFREVYLVEPSPLKLEQTKIVSNYSQVEIANYLKNVLGFGTLKAELAPEQQKLILQIGEDALDLPRNDHHYRQP
jgi:polyisoprenyl-teichoic acid--peptidoglycan teichoic acid transferase